MGRTARAAIAALVAVWTIASAGQAVADQKDPRLERLFDRLQTVESPINAQGVTNAIWLIWLEHENPQVVERMYSGMDAMRQGNHFLALVIFDDLIARVPDYAEAWNKRATVHYLMGNYPDSLQDIEKTLELEPRHFGALEGRGLIFGELGLAEEELQAYEAALQVNPHLPGAKSKLEALRGESERI
ncbi:tetratricopeptide repeat protein [Algihabitans albus]|uniref:tetratricopeptide repeat protein n=1 Tax=Algihabitans albus TaxID=2164067 RepID=UPI001ABD0D22|nr:tetratricopeptide repeat protein [Algihabitans albus]